MRYLLLICLLSCSLALSPLTVIDNEREYQLSLEDLSRLEQTELQTERERDGRVRIENWQGVLLAEILEHLNIGNFARLRFNSCDGYQVRITLEEFEEYPVLIALQRNGIPYEEDDLRLVIPGMRDMYWMQAIETVRTEEYQEMPLPYFIFFAEDLLTRLTTLNDPPPFRNIEGYYFSDLISAVFPFQQDEYLLTGRDGVSHQLDYETYLQSALLVFTDEGYILQGADIPHGMWIKDIAYIQCFDRAIIFREQFEDLQEVKELLQWESLPAVLRTTEQEEISVENKFSDPVWRDRGILRWLD